MPLTDTKPSTDKAGDSLSSRLIAPLREYVQIVRLFSRNARLFLLGACLMAIFFHVFMLLLNLYMKSLGFLEGDIGMVNSARSMGMTLMAIPVAVILNQIKLKPLLLFGTFMFALFSVGLILAGGLYQMLGFSFLSGTAFSTYRVATGPFFMRNSTPKERTHLFSFSFAVWILAGMLGSVGSGQLVVWLGELTGNEILGYQYTLLLGVGISLLALIPFALIKSAPASPDEKKIRFTMDVVRKRWRFYAKITSVNFLVGMGAGLSIPFLNLYFQDRFALSADRIGTYYFFVMASMFIGTLAGPLVARRYGLVRTVVVTQFLSVPFMLILAYSYYLPLVFAAFVLRGGLMNMGVPLVTNVAMELSNRDEQGLVNALLMIAWTGSWAVSIAVGGELIEKYGFTPTLTVTAGLYLLSTVAFHFFFRRVEHRHEDSHNWYIPEGTRL